MTLSRAVAVPGLIAGRIPLNVRRAGTIALLPCDLVLGPGHGRCCVEPQGAKKRERGEASRAKAWERSMRLRMSALPIGRQTGTG